MPPERFEYNPLLGALVFPQLKNPLARILIWCPHALRTRRVERFDHDPPGGRAFYNKKTAFAVFLGVPPERFEYHPLLGTLFLALTIPRWYERTGLKRKPAFQQVGVPPRSGHP